MATLNNVNNNISVYFKNIHITSVSSINFEIGSTLLMYMEEVLLFCVTFFEKDVTQKGC